MALSTTSKTGTMHLYFSQKPTTAIQNLYGLKTRTLTLFLVLSSLFFSWSSYGQCPVDEPDIQNGTNSPYSGDCDLSAFGNITIFGAVVWNGGTVTINGNLTVAFGGSLTIDPATTFNVNGNFTLFLGGSGVINGTINATGDLNNIGGNLGGNGYISFGGNYNNPGGFGGETGAFAGGCGAGDCGDITLPVKMVSFKGTNSNNQVQLIWQTASELNNEGFEVHKSVDGDNFTVIGFVDGNGTTSDFNTYFFSDSKSTQNAYYRLRQVDFDGAYEFSSIIFIQNESNLSSNINIYPNPTNGNVSIEGDFTSYILMDTQGRVIHKNFSTTGFYASSEISSILKNQESGVYFLKTQTNITSDISRIIKK